MYEIGIGFFYINTSYIHTYVYHTYNHSMVPKVSPNYYRIWNKPKYEINIKIQFIALLG